MAVLRFGPLDPPAPKPRETAEFLLRMRAPGQRTPETQTRWRREWDSNPRYPLGYTRFPSVRLRPLGHLFRKISVFKRGAPPGGRASKLAEREGFEPSMGF